MLVQINELMSSVGDFILPFTRVAALFSVAPILSSPFLQLRIKVAIASVITIFMLPLLTSTQEVILFSANGFIQVGVQVLIGLLMGFMLRLVFSALTIAGENIAVTMGLGFAQITDPVNGVTVPIVSQFLSISATLLFLALDGHLALLNMLFDSFTYWLFISTSRCFVGCGVLGQQYVFRCIDGRNSSDYSVIDSKLCISINDSCCSSVKRIFSWISDYDNLGTCCHCVNIAKYGYCFSDFIKLCI
jgi:hypothetical protein